MTQVVVGSLTCMMLGIVTQAVANTECVDVPGFKDAQGYGCISGWKGYICQGAVEEWGYTQEQEDELLANCPATCGTCEVVYVACNTSDGSGLSSTYPCSCGSITCETNHVCIADASTCTPAACTVTNGSGLSGAYPCMCGNTTCATTNDVCTADSSTCTQASCDITDGSSFSSSYPCTCGSLICFNNQACTLESSHCDTANGIVVRWPCATTELNSTGFARVGTSASGAPVYASGPYYIYFDRDCSSYGLENPLWILDDSSPDMSSESDLAKDKDDCTFLAKFETTNTTGPPSGDNDWLVQCGHSEQVMSVSIHLQACGDRDGGSVDRYGYTCANGYTGMPQFCGMYDDVDFSSADMCCECVSRVGGYAAQASPQVCWDNYAGKADRFGFSCGDYALYPHWCGHFDDTDFSSILMCCGCDGGAPACYDGDSNVTDSDGYTCARGYAGMPQFCGSYDDTDFSSSGMCCECGGGRDTEGYDFVGQGYCRPSGCDTTNSGCRVNSFWQGGDIPDSECKDVCTSMKECIGYASSSTYCYVYIGAGDLPPAPDGFSASPQEYYDISTANGSPNAICYRRTQACNYASGDCVQPCSDIDGLTYSVAPCACGDNVCQAGFGFCNASSSTCTSPPTCTVTDGSSISDSPCMCGSSECGSATWRGVCDANADVCELGCILPTRRPERSNCPLSDRWTSITICSDVARIPENAFKECTSLEQVWLPDSLSTIEKSAFSGCSALTEVWFNSALTTIGNDSFEDCMALSELRFPDSLTTIGDSAFKSCQKLAKVEFGESMTSIGDRAFHNCSALMEVRFLDSLIAIGDSAFHDCKALQRLWFPDSLTTIGNSAFQNCEALATAQFCESPIAVEFPITCSKLTRIPENAFRGCASLEQVWLPESLTTIAENAFRGCSALTEVQFPDSVTTIGDNAFQGCELLAEVKFGKDLITIGESAFCRCSALTEVHFSSPLNTIGENAFLDCEALVNVLFGEFLTKIGVGAFRRCRSLRVVQFGNSLANIMEEAFADCEALTDVWFPDSLATIGDSAFFSCSALTHVRLGRNLNFVGARAFEGCCNVTSVVTHSDTLHRVIPSCAHVTSVTMQNSSCSKSLLAGGCGSVAMIKIRGGDVPSMAWENCRFVSVLHIEDVRTIGFGAFRNLESVQSLHLGHVEILQEQAFQGATSLESLTIGSVEYIGKDVFAGNDNLTSVTIPSPFPRAFSDTFDCSRVTTVSFSTSTTDIMPGALESCTSVLAVSAVSVQSIGRGAFQDCHFLSSINLSDALSSVGPFAFHGCRSLVDFDVFPHLEIIGQYAFSNCSSLVAEIKLDSVATVNAHAFDGCSSLRSVVLPTDATQSIAEHAFARCSSLNSVVLHSEGTTSSALRRILDFAFLGCSSLASIVIPDSVEEIGRGAFQLCTGLKTVTLPAGISLISKSAFNRNEVMRINVSGIPVTRPAWFSYFDTCEGNFQLSVYNDLLECACPLNHRYDMISRVCEKCERYLTCPGGHPQRQHDWDLTVTVQPGYMTLADRPYSVYRCVDANACAGERQVRSDLMCARNHDIARPQCATCDSGSFFKTDGLCQPCEESISPFLWLQIPAFIALQLGGLHKLVQDSQEISSDGDATFGCMIGFVQTVQTLSRLDLKYPIVLADVFDALNFVRLPDILRRVLIKPECWFGSNFKSRIYLQAAVPLLLFPGMAVLAVFYRLFRRTMPFKTFHNVVGLVFTGLFLSVMQLSLSLFFTVDMPNGKHMVLSFPELEYGSEEWLRVLPVNVCATLLYGATTVSYVIYAVWKAPRLASTSPDFMDKFDFCFGNYRPDRWWWLPVQLAFGVCLNFAQIAMPAGSVHAEVYLSLICLFVFAMLQFGARPFQFSGNNVVDLVFKLTSILVLIAFTSFIDTSSMIQEEIDKVNFALAVLILVTISASILFGAGKILRYRWRNWYVKARSVATARTVWQLRDVALAMQMLPVQEINRRLASVHDHEHKKLKLAMKALINVMFDKQVSSRWKDQRLMPGSADTAWEYRVWDPAAEFAHLQQLVMSGSAATILQEVSRLRAQLIPVARAIYNRAGITENQGSSRGKRSQEELVIQTLLGMMRRARATDDAAATSTGTSRGAPSTSLVTSVLNFNHTSGLTVPALQRILNHDCLLALSEEDVRTIFNVMDADSSGIVTIQEFSEFLVGCVPPALTFALQGDHSAPQEDQFPADQERQGEEALSDDERHHMVVDMESNDKEQQGVVKEALSDDEQHHVSVGIESNDEAENDEPLVRDLRTSAPSDRPTHTSRQAENDEPLVRDLGTSAPSDRPTHTSRQGAALMECAGDDDDEIEAVPM